MNTAIAPSRCFAGRLCCAGAALLLFASTSFAQDARAIQLQQQRKSREAQYKTIVDSARNMANFDARHIEDVFQIRLDENKSLICVTPKLDIGKQGQFRLELENFKGPTYIHSSNAFIPAVRIVAPGKAVAQPVPQAKAQSVRTFSFNSYELPNPDTLTILSVQSYPSSFHVERNTQFNDGHSMVRLMEQRNNPGMPGGGSVQLWVIHYGGGGQEPVNISIQEPDFPTLLQNHPNEIDLYVRPLLRQLGQEQLFAPNWRIAWQVLADYWPADETVGKAVASVLPDLDDADFRRREQAVAVLVQLNRSGAAVLRKLNRTGLTAEQNRLIDLTLAPYDQLPPKEASRLRGDKNFLLDCLYSEDAMIRKAAVEQLRKTTARNDLAFDADAAAAERFSAVRELRQELTGKPATKPATQPSTKPE